MKLLVDLSPFLTFDCQSGILQNVRVRALQKFVKKKECSFTNLGLVFWYWGGKEITLNPISGSVMAEDAHLEDEFGFFTHFFRFVYVVTDRHDRARLERATRYFKEKFWHFLIKTAAQIPTLSRDS